MPPRRRSASVSIGMDRDLASVQRARAALPPVDPFSSRAADNDPVLYRPAHSPPNEPAASSSTMASPKADAEARRRLRSSGGPRRRRPSPPAECDRVGGGGADAAACAPDGAGEGVYTQLQTELYPHMNFF
jgi:hypothetical protein